MADDNEFDHIVKNSQGYLNQTLNMKIIHVLKNLPKSVMPWLSMEHTF